MSQDAMFAADEVVPKHTSWAGNDSLLEELKLPTDFAWGTATAAYQIEGGALLDGKGPSIWDTYSHLEPSRTSGDNADVACDHYHRVPDDVELMASLGVDAYRFSLSWSRIIPLGGRNDPVNERGIAFYNDLIDRLLARNIEPVVTLYHWDAPQGIYDSYGAFLNTDEFRADFERYARLCFTRFGDRVRKWITFNEPYVISIFGYINGTVAPGHCRDVGTDTKTEPWRTGHTIILTHAAVVALYTAEFQPHQKGEITIVLNGHFYEPYDAASEADRDAAERRMVFYIGWFGDPVFLGRDYPAVMRTHLGSRLPTFTPEELDLLHRTAPLNAFYGMNFYTAKYARALPHPPPEDDWTGNVEESATNSEGLELGPLSGMAWLRMTPLGFRKMINWIWNRYHLPIIVTENGCPCPGEDDVEIAVEDKYRQQYFHTYLNAISKAIYEDGVVVKGYYAWSLMDNFEWAAGFKPRYGIVHVDYKTLKRTPKNSARYLKNTFPRRRKASP